MNVEQIRTFLKAGNAIFTIQSQQTGIHYTLRAHTRKFENRPLILIYLLIAPDTYTYMGVLDPQTLTYRETAKSPTPHAMHVILHWFFKILQRGRIHEKLIFRHEGKCARCSRRLTTPESIDSGIGPICAGRLEYREAS